MAGLTSQAQRDDAFAARHERMAELVAELRERTERVARGGGEKAVARHRERGNPHAIANHEQQSVVYTSTHDNDTARGWFQSLPKRERERTGLDPREPSWSLIELAHSSRAALSIIPAQDVLGLGGAARMNRPGTASGNWRWRLRRGQLTAELAARLRESTARGDRLTS